MLMDLYDNNPSHPIQYYFDDRFKGHFPAPDLNMFHTATSTANLGILVSPLYKK